MSTDEAPRIPAILLAAGKSERMGENKLLLPFGGRTVIQCTLDNLLASRAGNVIVVLGSKAAEIKEAIGSRRAEVIFNPDYAQGMSTSLRKGLSKVESGTRFVMVALGDQPLIPTSVYDQLMQSALDTGKSIILPVYHGERGNPIVISMRYRDELLGQTGDVGGRELLKSHPEDVLEVPVDSEGVTVNINTKKEYEKRLASLRRISS